MPKHGQLTDRTVRERQVESGVDKLDELDSSRAATVELHAMEPQLGVVEEVERGKGDTLVLRRLADMKVSLAAIEPQKGIPVVVVF
jgi:hypothetical protein